MCICTALSSGAANFGCKEFWWFYGINYQRFLFLSFLISFFFFFLNMWFWIYSGLNYYEKMLIIWSSCSWCGLPFRLLNIFPVLFSPVIRIVQCNTTRWCRFQFLFIYFKHGPECVLVCTWALPTRTEVFFLASYLVLPVYMQCIPCFAIPENIS